MVRDGWMGSKEGVKAALVDIVMNEWTTKALREHEILLDTIIHFLRQSSQPSIGGCRRGSQKSRGGEIEKKSSEKKSLLYPRKEKKFFWSEWVPHTHIFMLMPAFARTQTNRGRGGAFLRGVKYTGTKSGKGAAAGCSSKRNFNITHWAISLERATTFYGLYARANLVGIDCIFLQKA